MRMAGPQNITPARQSARLGLAFWIGMLGGPIPGYAQNLEEAVCGVLEPIMFWLWSNAAGSPNKAYALRFPNVETLSFTAQDGRVLRGFRIKAALDESRTNPQGYLLIAQGNAMLADQLVGYFTDYASHGYDVYLYDYRGYGLSEGKARLKAIVADYRAITARLNGLAYQRRLMYGISFGGIVILNVIGDGYEYDAAVIDSTPSRLSSYGCPAEYDPVDNLPNDSSGIMIIAGERDRVVKIKDMQELLEEAEQKSAMVIRDKEFSHPFMDTESLHRRRMEKVKGFLLTRQINSTR